MTYKHHHLDLSESWTNNEMFEVGFELFEIPAHCSSQGTVDQQVRGIGIKDEVAFTEPSGMGGWGEAEAFGEAGGFKDADVVIAERGEQAAIARGGHGVEPQMGGRRGVFGPIVGSENAYAAAGSGDDAVVSERAGLHDRLSLAESVEQPTLR